MPKKRKTRPVTTQSRPKPTLPEGDEGIDLEPEDRQKKLQVMIADFENEMQARIISLRNEAKNLATRIRGAYSLELMKIPKHVREMKVSDFLQSGGEVNAFVSHDAEKDILGSIDAKLQSVKIKQRAPLQTVNEEDEYGSGGRPPTGKQKRPRALQVKNTSAAPASRTVRKTRQKMYETPGYQPPRAGWETPLVTPKFDPRLPITPAVGRNPKPGERIMSITGSPIYIDKVAQPQGRKGTLILSNEIESELDHLTTDNLDENTLLKLRRIQQKLGQIIQKH